MGVNVSIESQCSLPIMMSNICAFEPHVTMAKLNIGVGQIALCANARDGLMEENRSSSSAFLTSRNAVGSSESSTFSVKNPVMEMANIAVLNTSGRTMADISATNNNFFNVITITLFYIVLRD